MKLLRRPQAGWFRFSLRTLLVCVLVVALLVTGLFVSKPLRISKETTYITEPLKSDGKQVDYFAAVEKETYPDNLATEENGYRLLVQHLGMSPDSKLWQFQQVCTKLGLDADSITPDLTYEDADEFLRSYVTSEKYDETIVKRLLAERKLHELPLDGESSEEFTADEFMLVEGDEERLGENLDETQADRLWWVLLRRVFSPWTLEDLPMMKDWLKSNSPALDLVGVVVRKPTFHIPMARRSENDRLYSLPMADMQQMRMFARGLSPRAQYRMGTGDIDGAIDDIVTCKRLGRHFGHGASLVDWLVGIAIEGIAEGIGPAGSLEHPPTKVQLERLVRELDELPPAAKLVEKMCFERYLGLDILQGISHGDDLLNELFDESLFLERYLSYDWNIAARRFNEHFDSIIASGVEPSEPSFSPMFIISRRARSRMIGDKYAALYLPAVDAAEEAFHRARCLEQLRRISLAMLLYECDHGTLPPTYTADAAGNPLHSWRVLLLPYLGQEKIYERIRLNEPWDSDYNQQFHAEDVAFYRCPSVETAKPGETTYSVVVGREMPFEGGEGKELADFGPDSEDMILLVERAVPVCWMEPAKEVSQAEADAGVNVQYDPITGAKPPVNGIASPHPIGASFGLRNGSVRFITEDLQPEVFRNLLRGTNAVDDY